MKVLVADDDAVSRLMLQGAVEALGHTCLVAEDGAQAWQLYAETSPDVLITDLLMPGLNGLELCRRVRARSESGYTYIILATGLVERDDVLSGMQAGADDYLSKPLAAFDLEARLIAAERVTSLHAQLSRYRSDLARLACTDPLTQLRNRRSLEDDLSALHARSQRYQRNYCLVMCDVDRFKAYNDTFGHPSGDEVLRAVGATLSTQARHGDSVYRYGGEEFLLILPEQTPPEAAVVGERIRRAVLGLCVAHPGGVDGQLLTISVGVAGFRPGDVTTSDGILAEADQALYAAKASGRNRVAIAP
ncbi:MAG TPA: diguanylate cyclase [Mycobacteriales bacterium]|jgi:diguanylate cyclase (GGDEF)-like protein|nr:diguanylate cyclase [Mycobacteriales bacterium]